MVLLDCAPCLRSSTTRPGRLTCNSGEYPICYHGGDEQEHTLDRPSGLSPFVTHPGRPVRPSRRQFVAGPGVADVLFAGPILDRDFREVVCVRPPPIPGGSEWIKLIETAPKPSRVRRRVGHLLGARGHRLRDMLTRPLSPVAFPIPRQGPHEPARVGHVGRLVPLPSVQVGIPGPEPRWVRLES